IQTRRDSMASKHWLITGANRGIGLAIVEELLKTGEQVTALARNSAKATELQKLVAENPARLRVLEADVTKDTDLKNVAKEIGGEPIDVLINNAGIYKDGSVSIEDLDPKVLEHTFAVNVVGPFKVTQVFLPSLMKAKNPVVGNITSLMGSMTDNSSGGSYAYRI